VTSARTGWYALLGHPVAHSRSPAMMTAALRALRIDAVYLAHDVTPDALERAVRGLRALGCAGANVTVPHKRAVLAVCDVLDPVARAVGAVNTLVLEDDGIRGCNTDAEGAMEALMDAGAEVAGARVVVLGAGGAARAVAAGAALSGAAEVTVLARRREQAEDVARAVRGLGRGGHVGAGLLLADEPETRAVCGRASVVVQATPVGMEAHGEGDAGVLSGLLQVVRPGAFAMDLVYAPRETPWLRAARDLGLRPVDGLGMLAHQGALALSLWTGAAVPARLTRAGLDAAGEGAD
jgi:shikimate dehydrogenase